MMIQLVRDQQVQRRVPVVASTAARLELSRHLVDGSGADRDHPRLRVVLGERAITGDPALAGIDADARAKRESERARACAPVWLGEPPAALRRRGAYGGSLRRSKPRAQRVPAQLGLGELPQQCLSGPAHPRQCTAAMNSSDAIAAAITYGSVERKIWFTSVLANSAVHTSMVLVGSQTPWTRPVAMSAPITR